MNFLVPFPDFNGKVKAKYNTCLQLCQNGRQPSASAHLCCSSLPDLTVTWAPQVSSAGNHIKDTRTSWPVSNQHVTRWSLPAMTWTLEPSFSLSPSLTVVLFNEFQLFLVVGYSLNIHILSIFITLPTKFLLVKAMVFPVVMYGCESWTVKKAEHQRIDAFELWCWRGLLRVPQTARRSNQSILKEISPEYSLEGLMLKLKLQYFGHLN